MRPLAPDDPRSIGGYRLEAVLGHGGMGRVYYGRSPGGRPVAVKVVQADLAADPGFRRRFAREVEAARRVGGFHTAPIVDAGPADASPWVVTAFVPGPTLAEAAREGLPEAEVRALGAALAEGLAAIHACGLVHRDIKPANVILGPDGPRIIDFGIARGVDSAAITRTGGVLGTAEYMAPGQVRGEPPAAADDVFSLGGLLVYAATARPPFGRARAEVLMYRVVWEEPDLTGLGAGLRGVVAVCLDKDPARRPAAADLVRRLAGAGEADAGYAPGPGPAPGAGPAPDFGPATPGAGPALHSGPVPDPELPPAHAAGPAPVPPHPPTRPDPYAAAPPRERAEPAPEHAHFELDRAGVRARSRSPRRWSSLGAVLGATVLLVVLAEVPVIVFLVLLPLVLLMFGTWLTGGRFVPTPSLTFDHAGFLWNAHGGYGDEALRVAWSEVTWIGVRGSGAGSYLAARITDERKAARASRFYSHASVATRGRGEAVLCLLDSPGYPRAEVLAAVERFRPAD
ncbi:serine/threonine-protein kinase [Streptomyces aculeolatus]